MSLHRLTSITLGVPDVDRTVAYYAEFGLSPVPSPISDPGTVTEPARPATWPVLSTVEGGEQLRVAASPRRRLLDLGVGADDPDDLDRVAAGLTRLGVPVHRTSTTVTAVDGGTGVAVRVEIAPRIEQRATPTPPCNAPGSITRTDARAAGILRTDMVRPRKLGHVVLGSVDQASSQRFFTEGIGFRVSDTVPGLAAFLRCSTDHHNVLVQQAPVAFVHHTSWQVDDIDEVGRGATSMLAADPQRHVWGLGRHHIGSNFFWYLKDPAGNFSEYYADLDCIVDDALWKPGVWEGMHSLYSWGPPPPASFLAPDDLAALMTGAHEGTG